MSLNKLFNAMTCYTTANNAIQCKNLPLWGLEVEQLSLTPSWYGFILGPYPAFILDLEWVQGQMLHFQVPWRPCWDGSVYPLPWGNVSSYTPQKCMSASRQRVSHLTDWISRRLSSIQQRDKMGVNWGWIRNINGNIPPKNSVRISNEYSPRISFLGGVSL